MHHPLPIRLLPIILLWALLPLAAPAASEAAPAEGDWLAYGRDLQSTKFSPLTQIDSTNVADLRMIWRVHNPDFDIDAELAAGNHNRTTPLAVGGVIYTSTPLNLILALDGATGAEIWRFDPRTYAEEKESIFLGSHRGVAWWEHPDGGGRILFGTSNGYLYSLDAATGQPDPAFGQQGRVDLTQALERPAAREAYGNMSPPVIVDGVAVIGSALIDWWQGRDLPELPPLGDVRGFDAATGELLWTFHTIPAADEFGSDTWKGDSGRALYGAANAWAPLTADPDLGYVYLPISTPSSDYYGGGRPGDNLFGDSIVCLDARTGRRVWHYQLIHHGVFDYDPNAAPVLMDVTVDGTPRRIVAQTTKMGFCFVFDRVTGEPIWPINEVSVPRSTVPGEVTSPTQPYPTKPPPYERQGLSEDDLIDFTPELYQEALEIVSGFDYGPLYVPPSIRGTLMVPGIAGGSNWAGAVALPSGRLVVSSLTSVTRLAIRESSPGERPYRYVGRVRPYIEGPQGLPLTKPPYATLTSIDMTAGDFAWRVAAGDGPREHRALRDLDLPPLGWATERFVIGTPTLLLDVTIPPWGDHDFFVDPVGYLTAYAPEDGRVVAEVPLPQHGYGNPITYLAADGRQMVLTTSWDGHITALAVPRDGEELPQQVFDRSDATHDRYYDAVALIDAGDVDGLRALLAQDSTLVDAKGYLDTGYHIAAFRHATLLHHIAGEPLRRRLPDNALDLARVLLDAGADPDVLTHTGESSLSLSLRSNQLRWIGARHDMVRLLVARGADPNQGGGKGLFVTLARQRNPDTARLLIELGATPDLRFAAGLGMIDRLDDFVEEDGSLTPAAISGYRPGRVGRVAQADILADALGFAVYHGQVEAARWLLERGAEPNRLTPGFLFDDDKGTTALHKAVSGRHVEAVRLLVEHGADPTIPDANWNSSPGNWAGYYDVREILEIFDRMADAQ
jgi:quinoprotein glucose dehydrogenase